MRMSKDVEQLRALLGGLDYYRTFLPRTAARVRPINTLFKKNTTVLVFTDGMEIIFRDLLTKLASPPLWDFPDWDAVADGSQPFRLYRDASVDGLCGTL